MKVSFKNVHILFDCNETKKVGAERKLAGLSYCSQGNYCVRQIKQRVNNSTSHTLTQLSGLACEW